MKSQKRCSKCNEEKLLSEFYTHKRTRDGRQNKCKECAKKIAKQNRNKRIDYYRKYDRMRGNRQGDKYCKEYREKYPNKYKAHSMVNNFIRNGKLVKKPCEICGSPENIHAHHDDYLEPLNVRWLCSAHHSQWHAKNGEAKNP